MGSNKTKATKLYCLRKNGMYVAWDGKTMVEKPHEGIRVSRTMAERKYQGYQLIGFQSAYYEWYLAKKEGGLHDTR